VARVGSFDEGLNPTGRFGGLVPEEWYDPELVGAAASGTTLGATANTITITAVAAVLAAGTLAASSPLLTITAPAATLQAASGLAAAPVSITATAPPAALQAAGKIPADGWPVGGLVVTAPTATLQQAALTAAGQVLTLSAPAAATMGGGGALAAGVQPLIITAPTAVLVPLAPQVLTASTPTITMTAPAATVAVGTVDADGSASGRSRFVVLQDFEENRQEPSELYAGWQVITLSAPPARCVFLATPQPDAVATPRRSDDEEVITLAVLYLLTED
jgi:hypothetical protein